MTPSDILQYSLISVLFNHHQRSFLLQQTGTNRHSQSGITHTHRETETLEQTARNGMSPSHPSPQSSGNPVKEEAESI